MKKYLMNHEKGIWKVMDRHPVISMITGQFMVAAFMILSVGMIALVGGTAIWLIYSAMGIM